MKYRQIGIFFSSSMVIGLISLSPYLNAQTLISDSTGTDIVFSSLETTAANQNASNDQSSFGAQTAPEAKFGPYTCSLSFSPFKFKCENPLIPEPPPEILKEQQVILEFLKSKRSELELKEETISNKEQEIANLERNIEQKIDEITKLNDQITKQREAEAIEDTENLNRLVSYYEKIPPENAAQFFNAMDQQTAMMILTRMNPRKAAAVFTELSTDKAASLTESIAKINQNREEFLNLPNYEK